MHTDLQYEAWQELVMKQYNAKNDADQITGNVDICEDGMVFEGNLSYDGPFVTWAEYQLA